MNKTKLEEAAKRYAKYHKLSEDADKEKAKARKEFFEAIEFSEGDLATHVVYYKGLRPEAYIQAIYPRWEIVKKEFNDDSEEWRILLRENPDYKNFAYLDGKTVFQRVVSEGTPQPDLEAIREFDAELYQRITFQPRVPRELKPAEQISPEDMERIMDFMLPPRLTPTMQKPRAAKPEELGSDGE
jgi:hypothetical protein